MVTSNLLSTLSSSKRASTLRIFRVLKFCLCVGLFSVVCCVLLMLFYWLYLWNV